MRRIVTPAIIAFLCGMGAAPASDLADAPEIGDMIRSDTGWYLRLDVGHSFANGEKGARVASGPAFDTGRLSEDEDFSGGVGLGYKFNDILRADVQARYGRYDASGATDAVNVCAAGCRLDLAGAREVWDLDLNLYADLGTFMGITPYVGAGIGGSHVAFDSPAASLCAGGACAAASELAGQDGWRLSYSLMAGAAYAVTETVKLDLGYRYTHTDDDTIAVARFDGLPDAVLIGDDGADRHTVSAGLRFALPWGK